MGDARARLRASVCPGLARKQVPRRTMFPRQASRTKLFARMPPRRATLAADPAAVCPLNSEYALGGVRHDAARSTSPTQPGRKPVFFRERRLRCLKYSASRDYVIAACVMERSAALKRLWRPSAIRLHWSEFGCRARHTFAATGAGSNLGPLTVIANLLGHGVPNHNR